MKIVTSKVTLAEVPGEISLALSISNCPFRCKGCHTPELRQDVGQELTRAMLTNLLTVHEGVTCVVFLGGDQHKEELIDLLKLVRSMSLKTCLYTGCNKVSKHIIDQLDYIKYGPYREDLGGLDCETTNQRFLRLPEEEDITYKFQRKRVK